ncbi:hypothetical protein [Oerskovia sp. KBS0722]|uniref:hypothetical protein n=1 Tax=Oerskovia sp. KBS0722 TaxID=1179673 RepID=UPI00110F03BF|nr:hypothetical protein [Oerskovia sp. KBS0722]QDW61436.1 hypothetical protein FFI11_001880 [Oerskovia sp. KBS0722]
MASIEQAREAKAALRQALAGQDGVTGIGLRHEGAEAVGGADGTAAQTEAPADTWCLQVNVVDAAASGGVPQEVDGVAVVVRVTGRIDRSG